MDRSSVPIEFAIGLILLAALLWVGRQIPVQGQTMAPHRAAVHATPAQP